MRSVLTTASHSWQELADLVIPVMYSYCKKNGYGFEVKFIPPTFEFHKIKAILSALETSNVVFCLDLDTLITNHNIKFESFLDADHDFYITQDINEINAGAIIAKNTLFVRGLLNNILMFADAENEQNALKPFMDNPEVKILPHPSINSYPYDEYAPTWGLIPGRSPLLGITGKPTHEQGNWEPGDFIAHLPGLPMQRRLEIFSRMKDQIVW